MTTLQYLNEEWSEASIRCYFRQMKGSNNHRVQILSDLTTKSVAEIKRICGLAVPAGPMQARYKTPEWHIIAKEMWNRGCTDSEIAKVVKRTRSLVSQWRNQSGLEKHPDGIHLTEKQVNEIKKLHSQGLINVRIAEALGVTEGTISQNLKKLGLKRNRAVKQYELNG